MWRARPCSSPPRRRMSPVRFSRWTGAGVWGGNGARHLLHGVSRSVEPVPELRDAEARGGMNQSGRKLRQGSEHEGALEQIRARKLQPRLIADELIVEQDVQIHRSRRPSRCVTRPTAQGLDRLQALHDFVHRELAVEPGDEVDEIIALKTHGRIAVPRGETRVWKHAQQLFRGEREVALRFDIATGGNVDLRHGSQPFPADSRSARVRSSTMPTSREPRIAPGLFRDIRTQGRENSSMMSIATRCASVSTSLNSEASTKAITLLATAL